MKKQWSIILAIILLILISLFAMVNMSVVPVEFGFAVYEWPLILVILGSLLMGALVTTLLSTASMITTRKEKKVAENRIVELENNSSAKEQKIKDDYEKKISQYKQDKEELQEQINQLNRENKNFRALRETDKKDQITF